MPDDKEGDVPEGAAVFPLIPAELGVHPLLLGLLHATVFLAGSADPVVDHQAADETLQYIARYLRRLSGPDLRRVREDLVSLAVHARSEKWRKQEVRFLKDFLEDLGVGSEEAE
jgi:hypothetical protein